MIKYTALALGLLSLSAVATSTTGSIANMPTVGNDSKQGFHGMVGLGAASMPEYVGGDDTETNVLPLINVSYNDTFYFKFNRLGAWVYKSNSGFRVGGVVMPHAGWESGDGDRLTDLEDRDDSIMAGINAEYKKGMFSTEVGYVTDVSDESEGSKFYAQASYTMLANRQYTLTVNGKVEAWDEDLTSYYYSAVGPDGLYIADSTTNITLSLVGTYNLTKQWKLIGLASATSLGDEISDSPIVEDDTNNMFLLGAVYTF